MLRRLRLLRDASNLFCCAKTAVRDTAAALSRGRFGRYSGGCAAFVPLRIFFWLCQKLRRFAPQPSYDGKMLVTEPRRVSRGPWHSHKKYRPAGGIFYGGAEGNRTPVRKQLDRTFFGRSLLFTFPYRSGNKHPHRPGRVIMHGRVNSFPPHGHHSDHTLARLVVLPGRMGA